MAATLSSASFLIAVIKSVIQYSSPLQSLELIKSRAPIGKRGGVIHLLSSTVILGVGEENVIFELALKSRIIKQNRNEKTYCCIRWTGKKIGLRLDCIVRFTSLLELLAQ